MAWIAAISYLATIVLFFGLHFLHTSYNIIRQPVSDYGVGSSAKLFQLYGLFGTVGAAVLAYLFYSSSQPLLPVIVSLCMLLMFVARLGVLAFLTDLEGQPRTSKGIVHYVFAICTFAFAYTAIANATEPMVAVNKLSNLSQLLIICKYCALIGLVAIVAGMLRSLRPFFGLAERVFILATIVWFFVASLWFAL